MKASWTTGPPCLSPRAWQPGQLSVEVIVEVWAPLSPGAGESEAMACPTPGHLRKRGPPQREKGAQKPPMSTAAPPSLQALLSLLTFSFPTFVFLEAQTPLQSIGSLCGEAAEYLDGAILEHHPLHPTQEQSLAACPSSPRRILPRHWPQSILASQVLGFALLRHVTSPSKKTALTILLSPLMRSLSLQCS